MSTLAQVDELLAVLRAAGATIRRDGDFLDIEAFAPLPTDLLAQLRDAKPEIMSALAETSDCGDDAREERAAIVEFEGGIPRAWAEGFAQLDARRPPRDIPLERWRAVIDAIGEFLDHWAPRAITMGWDAADIFGADAIRPGVSWLNSGPLWYADGARVVEVHADRLVFETCGGARQSHYRGQHMRARRLPWELAS